jgi:hypothetical protein
MGCVPRDVWRCWRRHMRAALVTVTSASTASDHAAPGRAASTYVAVAT